MSASKVVPRSVKAIRWTARIWGLLAFAFTMLIVFSDPAEYPTLVVDWFLLGFWVAAAVGLVIAWRWELAGGIFTIAMMFLREIAWVILKGDWLVDFLILWALIATPAILFLVAWRLERKAHGPVLAL